MLFKIKKGKHRPQWWWLRRLCAFRFIHSTPGKVRNIRFTKSWRKSDPNAWHKLFGFSNGWNHHHTSCRWVCRYDADKDKMELAVYAYIGGQRIIKPVGFAEWGKAHELKLSFRNNVFEGSYYAYELDRRSNIVDGKSLNRIHCPYKLPKFGWFLGLYHGGKNPAPAELFTESDKYL